MLSRRDIVRTALGAGGLSLCRATGPLAFANAPGDARFVVVILRGALDGLAAVPPHGDPDYASTRGTLALDKGGPHALFDLDGFFGLHPALPNLKALWDAKQLLVFHNIASPYRDRSHFDGQDVLETGGSRPHLLADGWLNRALVPMNLGNGEAALAIAPTAPAILAGRARVASWMPTALATPDTDFLARVHTLYAKDTALRLALESALRTEAEAAAGMDDPASATTAPAMAGYGRASALFSGAGKLLAHDSGPRVAVLDLGGWDTHVNEGTGDGQLARRLGGLDDGLLALETALGPAWTRTAIVMATEFGRTVVPNGSGGTDHGTAGAAFLLGGAVRGGMVKADWVGLKPSALKDGRDQPPRSDIRSVFKGVLADHMKLSRRDLENSVFPDSELAAPVSGLFST
jgi:uncharacterized protein (DUF1501 family)